MQTHHFLSAAAAGLVLVLSPAAPLAAPGPSQTPEPELTPAAAIVAQTERRAPEPVPTAAVTVGDIVDPQNVHLVTHPGRYGLSNAPSGHRYAIVNGKLVRIDAQTGKIMSVLRAINVLD